jgi:hypothetical protein
LRAAAALLAVPVLVCLGLVVAGSPDGTDSPTGDTAEAGSGPGGGPGRTKALSEDWKAFAKRLNKEFHRSPDGAPAMQELGREIMARVDLEEFWDDSTESAHMVSTCVRVLGKSRLPGADDWVLRAFDHPSSRVRHGATLWYAALDPDWRKNPAVAERMEAARKSLEEGVR